MSGIDEQFRSIPKCPICGEEPEFWVLSTTIDGSSGSTSHYHITVKAWLFSEKYMATAGKYYQHKHVGVGDKRFGVEVDRFLADYITSVESDCHSKENYTIGPVFDKVKALVAYWLRKEGFGSEWNR